MNTTWTKTTEGYVGLVDGERRLLASRDSVGPFGPHWKLRDEKTGEETRHMTLADAKAGRACGLGR